MDTPNIYRFLNTLTDSQKDSLLTIITDVLETDDKTELYNRINFLYMVIQWNR